MKRFIAFALCAVLAVCAFTLVASAEEAPAVDEPPVAEETPIAEEPPVEEPGITDIIVDYVKAHVEEISVILTLIVTLFYNVRKQGLLDKSIGTLNNNAISVVESSTASVQNVLSTVMGYSAKIEAFLAEARQNEEAKEKLETMLAKVEGFLETAKLANVELANEVAELLVLANIPISKKDELYGRHLAAVNAISDAEHTEVTHHDGEES